MKGRGIRGVALSECLERRLVLNGAFAHLSSRGTLIVNGDANANNIIISIDGASEIAVAMDGAILTFDPSSVDRIFVDAGEGNDFVAVTTRLRSTIVAGAGDDIILGGFDNDSILGGDGNDAIKGRSGADIIDGERGNDTVEGNGGSDTISFYSSDGAFDFHISDHETEFAYPDSAETPPTGFKGASYARSGSELDFINDVVEAIVGTRKRDFFEIIRGHGATMFGRGGADFFSLVNVPEAGCIVYGEAGNDVVTDGESAEYTVFGGSGDDVVIFEEVGLPSSFDGGPGIDAIDLSNAWRHEYDLRDYVSVENAINITQSTGMDITHEGETTGVTIIGTDGPNHIATHPLSPGEVQNLTILGMGGDDTIYGSDSFDPSLPQTIGADSIDGGDGDDLIFGRYGDDIITGGNGNDTISGDEGSDSIDGGAGNDLIHGEDSTKDTLDGGADTDSADRDTIDDVRNIESFI